MAMHVHIRASARAHPLTRTRPRALRVHAQVASRLYTGPLFTKYNAVLRGINSDVPALRRQMLELCCAAPDFEQYLAATAAALRDSRVTPCPLYTPKITLNQPPRVATLAMG